MLKNVWRRKSTTTYIKLQDAYVSESGIYVENWAKIDYTMQNSNNFTYSDANAFGWDNNTLELPTTPTEGWSATAIPAKLNDCTSGV